MDAGSGWLCSKLFANDAGTAYAATTLTNVGARKCGSGLFSDSVSKNSQMYRLFMISILISRFDPVKLSLVYVSFHEEITPKRGEVSYNVIGAGKKGHRRQGLAYNLFTPNSVVEEVRHELE